MPRSSPGAWRTLAELAEHRGGADETPLIVLTTVNAVLQRVPSHDFFAASMQPLAPGNAVSMADLIERLEHVGYGRAGTVTDPGQYAVRGGILDFYPPGASPVRLDFFGDTLESIRAFDPRPNARSPASMPSTLLPMSEAPLTEEARRRFRARYVELFGPVRGDDPLYESISAGRQHQGMEHWLPLFHERLETLFDYLPDAVVTFDALDDDARASAWSRSRTTTRRAQQALERKAFGAPPYNPVPPESLFLTEDDWQAALRGGKRSCSIPSSIQTPRAMPTWCPSAAGRGGPSPPSASAKAAMCSTPWSLTPRRLQGEGKRVLVACWSKGARSGSPPFSPSTGSARRFASRRGRRCWRHRHRPQPLPCCRLRPASRRQASPSSASRTSSATGWCAARAKTGSDVLTEVSSLAVGDLVVHADHGIGRFAGLATIEAAGEPHDCLEVIYQGGDKLYLPVENIEMLSRYGSDESGVQLDRLGGVAWQSRKARLKKRIRDIAEKLIKVAAMRELRQAPVITPPDGLYDEFSARFPTRRPRTRPPASMPCSTIWRAAAHGPADLRRCRLRQDRGGVAGEPARACLPASRWRWWCRPRCSPASTSTPSPSASAGCR